jgi:predicted AAA+ superfamily ATPase
LPSASFINGALLFLIDLILIFDYDTVNFRRKMTTWLSKMLKRILKPPSQSFFLLGPRGTGKSTWLQALFPDAHLVDLLSEATYQDLLANPGLLAENWL